VVVYDLFISYTRVDNKDGFVYAFVQRLQEEYLRFTGRKLEVFFDKDSIRGMSNWHNVIVEALRDSRLFVAFVSPDYGKSDYFQKEFAWSAQHEMHRFVLGDGVAPICVVKVPGFGSADKNLARWAKRMQGYHFEKYNVCDFFTEGIAALKLDAVEKVLQTLRSDVSNVLN
jgi:hypothetical protein